MKKKKKIKLDRRIAEVIWLARETELNNTRADDWLFEIKMESLGVEVKPC
jgi:hypothetical protein